MYPGGFQRLLLKRIIGKGLIDLLGKEWTFEE